jgi:hypothetical protein
MKLRYVSLTGADNRVDISELEQLSSKYPLFECAILMFPERDGLARNPTLEWRQAFYKSQVKNRALHLCGSAINKFSNGELLDEIRQFGRVQINLKPQWASPELVIQLTKMVMSLPEIEFITQYNTDNRDYFQYWADVHNHSYLYDGSLGKGVTPEVWLAPVEGKKTGYAGGLNPDNLESNLVKLKGVVGDTPVWIDMETGVRTDDHFDLVKVKRVLDTVNGFSYMSK